MTARPAAARDRRAGRVAAWRRTAWARWVSGRAQRRLLLARYWLARDDLDEAARHATHALRLIRPFGTDPVAGGAAPPLAAVAEAALVVAYIERERTRYADSEEVLSWLVRVLDAAAATDERDRLLARTLVQLGDAHRVAGRYERSLATLLRALRLARPARTREPATLAAALTSLAIRAKELGAYERAERFYRLVGRIYDASGATTVEAATLLHNLAGLAHARRDYRSAELHARMAVDLRRRTTTTDGVELAKDLAVLAAALAGQDRHDEAAALLRQAMATCETVRPPRRYEIAVHLHNLASIEQACGRTAEAERCYRDALRLKEQLLGDHHPEVALVANNLATLLHDHGRHDEAAGLLRRALSIVDGSLPPDHPVAEAIRRNLGRADH